jgi:hypothetical protein
MLDVVAAKKSTTLSGTAEANSSVSIFDGTKLIDTVTAATDGAWSLNVTGNASTATLKSRPTGLDTPLHLLASPYIRRVQINRCRATTGTMC